MFINLLPCTFKSGAELQDLNGAFLGRFVLFNFLLHSIPSLLDRRHNGQNSDNFNVLAPFYSKRVITNLVKIGTILCPRVTNYGFALLKQAKWVLFGQLGGKNLQLSLVKGWLRPWLRRNF